MDDIDSLNEHIANLEEQLETVTEERDNALRQLEELKEIADRARDLVRGAAETLDKGDF